MQRKVGRHDLDRPRALIRSPIFSRPDAPIARSNWTTGEPAGGTPGRLTQFKSLPGPEPGALHTLDES